MPVNYPIGAFKPFSLAESIQASQASQSMKMNHLKIQAAQSQMAQEQKLRGLAQMATRPTYGPSEGPPEASGAMPQIQTGSEYSPETHAQLAGKAGETELASQLQEQVSKMNKAQREEAGYKATEFAKLVADATNPEAWDNNFQIAVDKGYITEDQYVPYSDQAWQTAVNQARTVEDILKFDAVKAPKSRNIRQGKDIVNQEWDDTTGTWKEVGRGPMSQQQINLRNTPSEVAAGKEFEDILTQANTSEDQLININRAKALIPDIEEGKLEPIKAWARQWGDALGVPVDTDKMSDAVSFNATMKTAVLDGMKAIKGTASEADRKTVEDSVAALENPEDANLFLLDTAESLAKRNIERADFYDKWAQDNNGSLLGVRRAWSKHIHNVPLLRRVKGKTYHYYKFKDQIIQANKNAFRDASPDEIDAEINRQWKMGK